MRILSTFMLLLVSLPALSQDGSSLQEDQTLSIRQIEEIVVVSGLTLHSLRFQIREAKEALFATFNELNVIEDFKVDCRTLNQTHTRINKHACVPEFFDRAITQNSKDSFSFPGGPPQMDFLKSPSVIAREQEEKFEELQAVIEGIAEENAEFRNSLIEFASLERELEFRNATCSEKPAVFFLFRKC